MREPFFDQTQLPQGLQQTPITPFKNNSDKRNTSKSPNQETKLQSKDSNRWNSPEQQHKQTSNGK
jgi:hypothetical protein